MNASIYAWTREPYLSRPFSFDDTTRLFVMPRERSLDIDDEIDFFLVEALWSLRAQAAG